MAIKRGLVLRAFRDRYTDLRSRSKVASTMLASPRRAFLSLTATGLLIDAAWNIVSGVTGALVAASATPYPCAHSILKLVTTAMLTPGTPNFFNNVDMRAGSIGPFGIGAAAGAGGGGV